MNAGATAERVYDAIRRRIMTRGFRPGERLDPAALAETLASSVTPVRDALHLLTGEGLVVARAGEGFHLPQLDQPALNDLYSWFADVVVCTVRAWPANLDKVPPPGGESTEEPAERSARLFAQMAMLSSNAEHAAAIASLNARLHAIRCVEPLVLGSIPAELDAIEAASLAREGAELRRLIAGYVRRRMRHSAEIVRALYRAG